MHSNLQYLFALTTSSHVEPCAILGAKIPQNPNQLPYVAHTSLLCHSLYDFVCRFNVEKFHHIHAANLSAHWHQNSSSHPGPCPWATSNAQPAATCRSLHPDDRPRLRLWCPQFIKFTHTCTQHKMNTNAHCNHKTAAVAWCITSDAPPKIWIGQMSVRAKSQHEYDIQYATVIKKRCTWYA